MIPLRECKNRVLYRVLSKTLSIGVFCKETGGFLGIRTKGGYTFAFEEFHLEKGPSIGTVTPLVELPEFLHTEITLGLSRNYFLEGWLQAMSKKYHA